MIIALRNCWFFRHSINRAAIEEHLGDKERDWPVEFYGLGDAGKITDEDRARIFSARHRRVHQVYFAQRDRCDCFLLANADKVIDWKPRVACAQIPEKQ